MTPVKDSDCVAFLQWALPRLRMRWAGFRRVRRQVCKRIGRRLGELGLPDTDAYREFLEAQPEEWSRLDALCRITVSRFHRDRGVFQLLVDVVLPELAGIARDRGDPALRCWSAGCASGEEPYTLAMAWHFCVRERFPGLSLRVLATDADEHLLERAREGVYAESSLRDLPEDWRRLAFDRRDDRWWIRPPFQEPTKLERQDIRTTLPDDGFHLILCRNLVFTYFDESLQREILPRIASRLHPGGALLVGVHETFPTTESGLSAWFPGAGIYRGPVSS